MVCLFRYAGIAGVPSFVQQSIEFAYGHDSEVITSKRIAAVQSISGTGACRLAGELMAKHFPDCKHIHLPDPTWGNHAAIFRACGLTPVKYRYYDDQNRRLDFAGLVADIQAAESGSLFLLHACAHNPTGCDPSPEQWDELSRAIKAKQHMVLFDNAYQVCTTPSGHLLLRTVHAISVYLSVCVVGFCERQPRQGRLLVPPLRGGRTQHHAGAVVCEGLPNIHCIHTLCAGVLNHPTRPMLRTSASTGSGSARSPWSRTRPRRRPAP